MVKKLGKVALLIYAVLVAFTIKLDVKAEVIWNTTGEKTPGGDDYLYKCWNGRSWEYSGIGKSELPKLIDVSYDVTYCYEEAYKMIDLVNAERKKAGRQPLIVKDELMDVAMQRAAETAIYWSHIRPNSTGGSDVSLFADGENLTAGTDLAIEANEDLVYSKGHYETMIDSHYSYAGYGCVRVQGTYYWVQVFSMPNKYYEDGYDYNHPENNKPVLWNTMKSGERKDFTEQVTIKVNPKLITLKINDVEELFVENETDIYPFTYYYDERKFWSCEIKLSSDQYNVKVLTPDIVAYNNGKLKGLKAGTAKVQFTLKQDASLSVIQEIKVKDNPDAVKVKNGSKVKVDGHDYKVTSTKSKTVSFYNEKKNAKTVTIPKSIKINGKTYKVTSISSNAFKNNKKLTKVTIGSNVKTIGSNAFSGCSKIKTITVKSTKVTKVGKNALKGIHKKAAIKVPKSKYTKYKSLFKGKGQKKSVKVKK